MFSSSLTPNLTFNTTFKPPPATSEEKKKQKKQKTSVGTSSLYSEAIQTTVHSSGSEAEWFQHHGQRHPRLLFWKGHGACWDSMAVRPLVLWHWRLIVPGVFCSFFFCPCANKRGKKARKDGAELKRRGRKKKVPYPSSRGASGFKPSCGASMSPPKKTYLAQS